MFPYVLDEVYAASHPEEYLKNTLPMIDASHVPWHEYCEKINIDGQWYYIVYFNGEELSTVSARWRDYYLTDETKLRRYLKEKLKEPGFAEWLESIQDKDVY